MNIELKVKDPPDEKIEPNKNINNVNSKFDFSVLFLFMIWLGFVLIPKFIEILLVSIINNTQIEIIIEENRWIQLVFQIISFIITISIINNYFKKKRKNFIVELGYNTSKNDNFKFFIIAIVFGGILMILRQVVAFYLDFTSIYIDTSGLLEIILYSIIGSFVISVSKETIYRGFLQNQLKKRIPQSLAIILISFLSYITKYDYSYKYEILGVITTVIVYGYLYSSSGNLYLTIGWHFINLFVINLTYGIFNFTPYELSYIAIIQSIINAIIFLGILISEIVKIKKKSIIKNERS